MPAEIPEERIFEAVIDTVLEFGYVGATTKQIAERAKISEMTLFRRFGNKDKLLRAALRFETTKFIQEAIIYTGDVQRDLERVITTYHHLLKERGRVILELIVEVPRRPGLRKSAHIPQEGLAQVVELIARYQREGKVRRDPPWQAALELLSPVFVIHMLHLVQPLPTKVDAKNMVERFLSGWAS